MQDGPDRIPDDALDQVTGGVSAALPEGQEKPAAENTADGKKKKIPRISATRRERSETITGP